MMGVIMSVNLQEWMCLYDIEGNIFNINLK